MPISSASPPQAWYRNARLLSLLCIGCGFLVLLARRTDQLTDAQVWVEEGAQIIPSFLEHGPRALLMHVNGYLITTSRLITLLALTLGGLEHYPGVSTALGLLFTAAIFFWIGTAPVIVPGAALLPLAVALVPSDVEVFVVPIYTLWFAGLALVTLLLWRPEDQSRLAARVAVAIVCGLSNPVVTLLAPIAVARAVFTRARHEALIAGAMLLSALVQGWVIRAHLTNSAMPAAAVAGLFLFSTGKHFNRRHEHLDWKSAVRELSLHGRGRLPVEYDGSVERQWVLKLEPCENHRLCKVP
jgi:hypothetical protein